MIFGRKYGTSGLPQREREWHRWFAWRPVRLRDGRVAWLSTVLRRRDEWITLRAVPWAYVELGAEPEGSCLEEELRQVSEEVGS